MVVELVKSTGDIYSSSCSCIILTGNFHGLQAATNIGNVSKSTIAGQPHQSSAAIPLSSHSPNVVPTTVPTLHSAISLPTSTPPVMPFLDAHESSSNTSRATNLVKPSFFAPASSSSTLMMPPVASSMPASPPLHPPLTMQRLYGTPLLQPFPPPTPPPSLTPTPNYGSVITRDKVRDALLKLVQVCPIFLHYLY